ncbi:MAG: phage terminase large subunit [Verrucomicrobia bacterium]|nr:phage terminase large subunit [Verrucomicrobiota bacterium]
MKAPVEPTEAPCISARDALLELARREARGRYRSFIQATAPQLAMTEFHSMLCRSLQRVADGECQRLILSCPPRHGKTTFALRRLVPYLLGHNPASEVILAGHSWELVKGHSRAIREAMQAPVYRDIFPDATLAEDSAALECWQTKAGGCVLSAGVGAGIVGRGAHVGIIDDIHPSQEAADSRVLTEKTYEWFKSSFLTRLYPEAACIVIASRWSNGDLIGRILASETAAEWDILSFPVWARHGNPLWPDRFNREWIEQTRKRVGERVFSAQYLCAPRVKTDNAVERDWWQYIEPAQLPYGIRWVRGFDPATSTKTSADYSATCRVGRDRDRNFYIDAAWFGRLAWPQMKTRLISMVVADSVKPPLHVEAVAGFKVAASELKSALSGVCRVRELRVSRDKLSRALPWVAQVEAGRVYLVNTPGNEPFFDELLYEAESLGAASVHDDCVDAVSIAFEALTKRSETIVMALE